MSSMPTSISKDSVDDTRFPSASYHPMNTAPSGTSVVMVAICPGLDDPLWEVVIPYPPNRKNWTSSLTSP